MGAQSNGYLARHITMSFRISTLWERQGVGQQQVGQRLKVALELGSFERGFEAFVHVFGFHKANH